MSERNIFGEPFLRPAMAPISLGFAEIERLCGLPIENGYGFSHLAGFTTVASLGDYQLVFLDSFSPELAEAIDKAQVTSALFVLHPSYRRHVSKAAIFTEYPREIFARLAIRMFDYYNSYWAGFEDTPAASKRRPEIIIHPGAYIHPDAIIGKESMIFPGAVIGPKVIIGERALIKPHGVIGIVSFGIFRDRNNCNAHLPHIGGVVIGNDVEVGTLSTVCAGTIHPTIVADHVKIDDHVHVGHNTRTDKGTLICANSVIAGSSTLGRDVVIAPNSVIIEKIRIGDRAFVGLGSNVLRDVPANTIVAGNPAKPLRAVGSAEQA